MRLLNVRSLRFREFLDRNLPIYAIASHRWLGDTAAEATFADVDKKRNTCKTGYKKLAAFAKFMTTYIPSIEWLWIDTCCINKKDAQEVTEAINSMFRWYLNATVCIAYLADISIGEDPDGFVESEWFRRGWTLQELIAPRTVIFLSQDWTIIGHNGYSTLSCAGSAALRTGRRLEDTIAHKTGIPKSVLEDCKNLHNFSIEERMKWVAGRETSREEDLAYCLFGLFEVSMPAIYGEGWSRANKRLLAAVSKTRTPDFGALAVAADATYDSYAERDFATCLAGTRTQLLDDIFRWALDVGGQRIFWLCGKAGTGKSTISRTVARYFDRQQKCLGASFFFKRGEGDRESARRFFPTIAKQLAQRLPGMNNGIDEALRNDICEKNLSDQFENLIWKPLSVIQSSRQIFVLVIDALDECESSSDIKLILALLSRMTTIPTIHLRVYLTSRPEIPIQVGFSKMSGDLHRDVLLEEIQGATIAHDFEVYFSHRLLEIKEEDSFSGSFDPLPMDWPGAASIEMLVQLAVPLFIFASTICRFIAETNPGDRLAMILRQRKLSTPSGMEKTYLPILEQLTSSVDDHEQARVLAGFRELVGSIVLLAEPQSAQSLSSLLQLSLREISARLRKLNSVLSIPSSPATPIRLFHLSFREFLVDPLRSDMKGFWVDEVQTHIQLGKKCLRLLSRPGSMRQDLCMTNDVGVRRAHISRERVFQYIEADVAYACCYWVWHLVQGGESLHDDGEVHKFLQSHLLHWLEALSWLGRLSWAITYLNDIRLLVKSDQSQLLAFCKDARRFLLRNRYVTDLAPLQLYSSALGFAPTRSITGRTFKHCIPEWLALSTKVAMDWSPEIVKFEGHEGEVTSVAFSPHGQVVASASLDTSIRVWNVSSGEETRKLVGHKAYVSGVAFSPKDGNVLASASHDWTVRLWSIETSLEQQKFEGHTDKVWAVAISTDGLLVASASDDLTVRIWSIAGQAVHTLTGHDGWVNAVSFSPDPQENIIASVSRDRTIRLWNTSTGKEIQTLKGHTDYVSGVAFSPDGQVIASASADRTIRLWNAKTGKEISKLEGHADWVWVVDFSPHGNFVASASRDETVRLWSTTTGAQLRIFEGHDRGVSAVAFSPDGNIIASGSVDKTVRVWNASMDGSTPCHVRNDSALDLPPSRRNAQSGRSAAEVRLYCTQKSPEIRKDEHESRGADVSVRSAQDQLLASGSADMALRVWNAMSGDETQTLQEHDKWVWAVSFSHDGQLVASASRDNIVRLWNATTGEKLRELNGHSRSASAVAFSPDRCTLASGSEDCTVQLWDVATGEKKGRLEGHTSRVGTIAFSPDSQIVASGSDDGTVRLWDTSMGQVIQRLEPHNGSIQAVAFSADGTRMASASDDMSIRLWDSTTGALIQSIQTVDIVSRLAFASNGRSLSSDIGSFRLDLKLSTSQPAEPMISRSPALNGEWISYKDHELLWLPSEYRGICSASYGNTLVLGQASGDVTFLRLDLGKL